MDKKIKQRIDEIIVRKKRLKKEHIRKSNELKGIRFALKNNKEVELDDEKISYPKLVFKIVSRRVVCALTGFGTFFYSYLLNRGIWSSMLIGMFMSSLIMILLQDSTTRGKK